MLAGGARGPEERAQLGLALAAAAAPHRVDRHEPALEHLAGVDGKAPLGGGDHVGARELEARAAHAEREPQVLAEQRPPRLAAAQVAAALERREAAAGAGAEPPRGGPPPPPPG